jgi:hypothetical protein
MSNNLAKQEMHNLVKNIDYSIRLNSAKYVLLASDRMGEGKSTFLATCLPLLAKLYSRQVLIYDCQSDEQLTGMTSSESDDQFIKKTKYPGVDYIHQDDLSFLKTASPEDKVTLANTHFAEISKDYDVVFINMKTMKRFAKTKLPGLPIDGAIIMRSPKSINESIKPITNELQDREIPILGLVWNKGT